MLTTQENKGAEMSHGRCYTMRMIATLSGIIVSSAVTAPSQLQTAHAAKPHVATLVSDACPVVHSGDKISLDWNPGFEHPGIVEGLRVINLRFGRLAANGVTVQQVPAIRLGGLGASLPITPIGNGYFHIELTIPAGAVPGEYHLIDASADAKPVAEYQGPNLLMTNSPVRERYCITVVPATPPHPPPQN
jgi:hypothetical protein